MRDDPRKNLKWLEQELLNEESSGHFASEDDDLMRRVDALIAENPEEAPVGNFSRKSCGLPV